MNRMNEMNLFEKSLNLSDKMTDKRPVTFYRGHVVIVDDVTGETILEKDNRVVLRGRTFALEKMFGIENNIEGFNKTDLGKKKICLWKVGNGGCVTGDPFNVRPVGADDRQLGTGDPLDGGEIPFRVVPGRVKPEDFKNIYYAPVTVTEADGNEYTYYYAKTFEPNTMTWIHDDQTDEIALKLTLKISEEDLKTVLVQDENGDITWERDTFINEIGLCIANYNESTESMDNIELATKLTFESEPYFKTNSLKEATIYYYIYA